jgi:hypothetical protein
MNLLSEHIPRLATKCCWARLGVLLLLWSMFSLSTALAAGTTNYTGHYQTPDSKTDWSFSLDVAQTGSKASVSFSAGMADGSGAAPDGNGDGKIDAKGALRFTFSDSFGNEGTGVMVSAKDGYHLSMNVTKAVEARALRYYGDLPLVKTSNKPSSS